jgi:hypothetical protein
MRQRVLRPFAVFVLVQFIAFSFIQTRLPHYMAPTYAPFAALVAIWLAAHVDLSAATIARRLQFGFAAAAIWLLAAFVSGPSRKALHSPRLPTGDVTSNNREQVALLKRVFAHPSPEVAAIPGPLLDWRPGHYNPIPTVIFYADRRVQQVLPEPLPPGTPTDIYSFNPMPLGVALGDGQPHLLLANRALLAQLPSTITFQPIAASATLAVGRVAMR